MAISRQTPMSKNDAPVDFDTVYLHYEGGLSWRVSVDRPSNEDAVFIPKTQSTLTLNPDGRTYSMTIPHWLAVDRGLV